MFHPHAEAARVRMFARMGVRMLVVLLTLAFIRDVSAAFVNTIAFQWNRPGDMFTTLWDSAWRASPWLIGAGTLLALQRFLIAWMVPTPPAGCVRCGYALPRSPGGAAGVCPECGLKAEADDDDTPSLRKDA